MWAYMPSFMQQQKDDKSNPKAAKAAGERGTEPTSILRGLSKFEGGSEG